MSVRAPAQSPSMLDAMEEVLWEAVGELTKAKAATGAELSAKFAVDASYALEYGSLDVFFQGLEGLLGTPSMHVPRRVAKAAACTGAQSAHITPTPRAL